LALAGAGLGSYLGSSPLPVLWPYLLAWSALGIWLATVRSPWSAGLLAALTLLLGSGLITLLQLGVGAGDSGWLRYGGSNAALAGSFGWLAWAGRTFQPGQPLANGLKRWWSLPLLGGVAVLLLMGQVLWGNEQGWAGLQPFELTKLALITSAAYALMPRPQPGNDHGWLIKRLRYLGPGVLLMVISGFALLFLRDFSPLVLLLLWALAMGWVGLALQPHPLIRRSGQTLLLVLVLALAGGLSWLQNHPEDFPLDFQADRIRVWATPDRYPHAGYQSRRALDMIRAGGWWGTIWTEAANGQVMHLPAVENDFTPAFLLNRYGSLAGLGLVAIQAVLIGIVLIIAGRALGHRGTGADQPAAPDGLAGLTLYGGAALLGAHFLVSWGTNLGFLPVMGQPMPLLSAAGSHLTLFVLPVIALAVAVEEQNHDDSR
jgi:cell division protein FtsW